VTCRWLAISLGLALAVPGYADIPAAERFLRLRQWERARLEARRMPPGADLSRRFQAQVLEVRALGQTPLGQTPAVRRLAQLQAVERRLLDRRALRALSILEYELTTDDGGASLERALNLSSTAAERHDSLLDLANFRLSSGQPDAARVRLQQAAESLSEGGVDLAGLARLALIRARLHRIQGVGAEEAALDLVQAQRLFQTQSDAAGMSDVAWERFLLADTPDEAERWIWESYNVLGDDHARMAALDNIAQRHWDLSQQRGGRVLKELDTLDRRPLPPAYRLYSYHIRGEVCRGSGLGRKEFLARTAALLRTPIPGLVKETQLVCHGNRGLLLSAGGREGLADLQAARQIAAELDPQPDDRLLASFRVPPLSMALSRLYGLHGEFRASEREARSAGDNSQFESDYQYKAASAEALLTLNLQMGRLQEAEASLQAMLRLAATGRDWHGAVTYFRVFKGLLDSTLRGYLWAQMQPLRVTSHSPAGWLLARLRRNPEQLGLLVQGLQHNFQEQLEGKDPDGIGSASVWYGSVLSCLERPIEAIDVYTRGLEGARPKPRMYATVLWLLARELLAQRRVAEAGSRLQEGFELSVNRLSSAEQANWARYCTEFWLQQGQPHKALALVSKLDTSSPSTLLLRAQLYTQLQRPGAARADLLAARALLADRREVHTETEVRLLLSQLDGETGGLEEAWRAGRAKARLPELPGLALRLGRALEQQGQQEAALRLYLESVETLRERYQQLPASGREVFTEITSVQPLLEHAAGQSLAAGRPAEAGRFLAFWRALEQGDGALPGRRDLELEELRAELTALHEAVQQSQDDAALLSQRLSSTRAQFLATLNRLRQENPQFDDAVGAQGSELLAIQPRLQPGTLLLSYYSAPDALYVQAVTPAGLRLESVRVERARLRELIRRWRGALDRPSPDFPTLEQAEASRQLYSLLLAPVDDLLANTRQLLILPGGDLWSLPFETLQDREGRYVVERCAVGYLAGSDLLQLSVAAPEAGDNLLAVGNARLEGTDRELQSIGALFPEARLLQGVQATKQTLAAHAPRADILHLATHSQAEPGNPNAGFLELQDGPLSLREVYALQLRPHSLVVLSSCESGVGQDRPGRELIALSTGFRAAGASAVISSLWRVDDQATARFFPPMYRSLLAGKSRAEALRSAKLELLAQPQTQHPFFWAAFTLLGDPR
jgi:CHAT domain-containing protein